MVAEAEVVMAMAMVNFRAVVETAPQHQAPHLLARCCSSCLVLLACVGVDVVQPDHLDVM